MEQATKIQIVSFNGTFDGELHPGHEHFFIAASSYGNEVRAFVNADTTVQTNKNRMPLYSQAERVRHVSEYLAKLGIKAVVYPLQGTNDEQLEQIASATPDTYCFGHDSTLPFDDAIKQRLGPLGTSFVVIPPFQRDKYSTTRLHFTDNITDDTAS